MDGFFLGGRRTWGLDFDDQDARMCGGEAWGEPEPMWEILLLREAGVPRERFAALHTEYRNARHHDPCTCDGEGWSLTVRYTDGTASHFRGVNAFPDKWRDLLDLFGIERD